MQLAEVIEFDAQWDDAVAGAAMAWQQAALPRGPRWLWSGVVWLFPGLMFGTLVGLGAWLALGDRRALLIAFMATGAWAYGWPPLMNRLGKRLALEQLPVDHGVPVRMSFDAEGFSATSPLSSYRAEWPLITRAEATDRGLFFQGGGILRYVAPGDCTPDEVAQILDWWRAAQ